jgi:hypothetical protein
MLELMIECWKDPASGESYRWSLWFDGKRVGMGGPHKTVEESERDALAVCQRQLGRKPNRMTRL